MELLMLTEFPLLNIIQFHYFHHIDKILFCYTKGITYINSLILAKRNSDTIIAKKQFHYEIMELHDSNIDP